MIVSRLAAIPGLQVIENVPLSRYTRFRIGGRARVLANASSETAFVDTLHLLRENGCRHGVIGGGTNLIVDDEGFSGMVLRYTASAIEMNGRVAHLEAGVALQDLVDRSIERGWRGLETMTGIPGWVGGAIYGNAGAYGHSIHELVESVRFFDGSAIREIGNAACEFSYRESVFKRHKDWIILAVKLRFGPADSAGPAELRATADGILKIRSEKYPPAMRCAGSIFKNLLVAELPQSARAQLPERVIREGKAPSAYFLEEAGVKGMSKGGIRVADYHANLIYNAGEGTAAELHSLIDEAKARVWDRFGLLLEEEVQYVGDRFAD